ncbi:hypothetical protein SK128_002680 [Halocaridina rubra]|uniref:Uncharacterized protein n=1 Tax=Halocaridina rubra TaxID=373956 RepID=A0AAN9A5U6_HALRR
MLFIVIPAVIYDRWLDFSPSGRRLEDIHAKTSFQIVASAFDLTVSFMKIPSDDLVSNTLWRSPNVSAVVSIGECAQNTIVQAVSKKMKKPFLLMNYEPCPVMMNHSLVLPLYKVKLHRRYQCMTHILYRWIAAGSQAGINSTSSINALLPKASLEYDKENYRLEYLNCVGPDLVLDINEIDPDSPPPEMEMALAKRFLNGRKAVIATIHVRFHTFFPPFYDIHLI